MFTDVALRGVLIESHPLMLGQDALNDLEETSLLTTKRLETL